MNNPNSQVSNLLNEYAGKIEAAVRADILAKLGVVGVAPKRSSSVPALSRAHRAPGAKRSPEHLEDLTKQLRAYIAKNPGQRIEQIGKAMGVETKELVLPIKKLIASKAINTRGQKRATTYSARG